MRVAVGSGTAGYLSTALRAWRCKGLPTISASSIRISLIDFAIFTVYTGGNPGRATPSLAKNVSCVQIKRFASLLVCLVASFRINTHPLFSSFSGEIRDAPYSKFFNLIPVKRMFRNHKKSSKRRIVSVGCKMCARANLQPGHFIYQRKLCYLVEVELLNQLH